jgi:hypothetical protein
MNSVLFETKVSTRAKLRRRELRCHDCRPTWEANWAVPQRVAAPQNKCNRPARRPMVAVLAIGVLAITRSTARLCSIANQNIRSNWKTRSTAKSKNSTCDTAILQDPILQNLRIAPLILATLQDAILQSLRLTLPPSFSTALHRKDSRAIPKFQAPINLKAASLETTA